MSNRFLKKLRNRPLRRSSNLSLRRNHHHRRLHCEALEDRRMLSIGPYPELPGMVLVDPVENQFQDQIVYLDFDGAADVTYDGPVVVEDIDIPAFAAPGELAGQEQQIIADVVIQLEETFAGTGIIFTTAQPIEGTDFSTVYIGGDDSAFEEYGSFLGLAEQVDMGNQDRADDAFAFADTILATGSSLDDYVLHEVGHLLGYAHLGNIPAGDTLSDCAETYSHPYGTSKYETKYISLGSGASAVTHTFLINGILGNSLNSWRTDWYSTIDTAGSSGFLESDSSNAGNGYWDPSIPRTFSSTGTYYVRGEVMYRPNVLSDFSWKETHQWKVIVVYDNLGPYGVGSLDLESYDDTGSSSSDNVTKNDDLDFDWTAPSDRGVSGVVSGVKGYYYSLSDSTPDLNDSYTASTSCTINNISEENHILYVRAVDNNNNLGDIRSLSFIVDKTSPGKPIHRSPGATTTDTTPTFDWDSVSDSSGVDYYELYIADALGTGIDNKVYYQGSSTSWTPSSPFPYRDDYTWKVRATDEAGNVGDWSSPWALEILGLPDLEVTSMEIDDSTASDQHFSTGESVQLDFQGHNDGDTTSKTSIRMKWWYGASAYAHTHEIDYGYLGTINGLASDEYEWETDALWSMPTTPGTYWLTVKIDDNNQQTDEKREDNNEKTLRFIVDAEPEVTALSFRNAAGNQISSIYAGQTVYLRADAVGMNEQPVDVKLYEDDGNFGNDDTIETFQITIGPDGFGTAEWDAEWQGDDGADPFNQYYLFYDKPWSLDNVYSGAKDTGHFLVRPPLENEVIGKATPTLIQQPAIQQPVTIKRLDSTAAINPTSSMTWVVVHGLWSSPERFEQLVSAIDFQRPNDQILVVDWSTPAGPPRVPGWVEDWIVPVATWSYSVLGGLGFSTSTLNFIGHSFGSYVSAEAAQLLGGVNTIIALDPAEDIPWVPPYQVELGGWYNPNTSVNFADYSNCAWAFYSTDSFGSGISGNEETPTTADEAIVVTGSTHSGVVDLFTNMLMASTGGVSSLFTLDRLLSGATVPWKHNQFNENGVASGGYEAVLATTNGTVPLSITYIDETTSQSKTVLEAVPEVRVDGNGVEIIDGDTTPSTSDHTNFGSATQGGAAVSRTFTVRNTGTATLNLGTPSLPSGYTITEALNGTIAASGSDTFTVRLSTTAAGTFAGDVSFMTNDSDENPFNFRVTGTILPHDPDIELSVSDVTLDEGNAGQFTPFDFLVTARNTGTTSVTALISVETSNGTATVSDNDYQPIIGLWPTVLELAPGQTSTFFVHVTVIGDNRYEDNETFSLRASVDNDGIEPLVVATGTGTILNDDHNGNGDVYEPDNDRSQSREIPSDGTPQTHSIYPVADVDWVKFTLQQTCDVTIETNGPSGDTRIWLYGPDEQQPEIAYDDDSGNGFFSKIVRSGNDALELGTYYVKIDEYYNNDTIASYTIMVTAGDDNPTVTIDRAADQPDPANSLPICFTIVFSEPVNDFNVNDITLGCTIGGYPFPVEYLAPAVEPQGSDGTTYQLLVNSYASITEGTLTASIAAGVAHDAAGNPNIASTSTDNIVAFDFCEPTVTINQATGQADPTSTAPINFSVVFREPVANFTTGDVTPSGTAPGTLVGTVTGSGTTYNVAVSGMTGDGTVIVSVAEGVATDAAGNPNTASTSTDNTVQYTATPAGPTISAVLVVEATGPRDGTLTTSESLLMTFNAEDSDGVASATVQVDGQNVTPVYGPYAAASGVNFGVPLGMLSAGAHNYTIVATDNAGNPTSPAYTGTFDVAAPAALGPVIANVVIAEAGTAKNGTLESSDNLVITWSATSDDGIASKSLTVDGQAVSTIYGPYGDYYAGVFGPLAAGSHDYTIEVTDTNGIASIHNDTFNVSASVVAGPVISNVVVAEAGTAKNGTLESSDNLVITWSATSDSGIASKSLTVGGQNVTAIYGPYGVNYAGIFGPLEAGDHDYTIMVTDTNGIASTHNGTFNVIAAASVAPQIGNVVVAETANLARDGLLNTEETLVFTWTLTDADGIASKSLSVDGNAVTAIYGPYGNAYAGLLGQLPQGTHTYAIQATDMTGQTSMLTGAFEVYAALTLDASAAPAGSVAVLTDAKLASIAAEAAHRLELALGSRASTALGGVSIEVADLPGNLLGATTDSKILIDRDAAGYGWFVDPTPGDDIEFAAGLDAYSLAADQDSPAALRADLLTTVMHEMGHVLGYDHADEGLMDDLLPLGTRRTDATDEVFGGYGE